jgi:LuxR family maltose regulon positive regulatory protein
VDAWPKVSPHQGGRRPTLRAQVEGLLWTALLQDLLGRDAIAVGRMAEALSLAGSQGSVRTFLDAGSRAQWLVSRVAELGLAEHARVVLAASRSAGGSAVELTRREVAVLRLLATPATNKAIAERLFISSNTLKTHLRRIYRKLAARSRLEAVHRARQEGLLDEVN